MSSERQTQEGTIDSQVQALRECVGEDEIVLEEELCFVDDGYRGSTLVRPALERMRDQGVAGAVDRLYVHSPDRLARRYAYQALLVDEFQHCGVELVFLNRPMNATKTAPMGNRPANGTVPANECVLFRVARTRRPKSERLRALLFFALARSRQVG